MKRRICSLLMAVVMVIGMLPMQAFAETVNSPWVWVEENPENHDPAHYDGVTVKSWSELETAIAKVPDDIAAGEIPSLLIKVDEFVWPEEGGEFTIDYRADNKATSSMPEIKLAATPNYPEDYAVIPWTIPKNVTLNIYEPIKGISAYQEESSIVVNGNMNCYAPIDLISYDNSAFEVNGNVVCGRGTELDATNLIINNGGVFTVDASNVKVPQNLIINDGGKAILQGNSISSLTINKGGMLESSRDITVTGNTITLGDGVEVDAVLDIYNEDSGTTKVKTDGYAKIKRVDISEGNNEVSFEGNFNITTMGFPSYYDENMDWVNVIVPEGSRLEAGLLGSEYEGATNFVIGGELVPLGTYVDVRNSTFEMDGGTIILNPGVSFLNTHDTDGIPNIKYFGTIKMYAKMFVRNSYTGWEAYPSIYGMYEETDTDALYNDYWLIDQNVTIWRNWDTEDNNCEHEWGNEEIITEPTDTTDGKKSCTCDKCGTEKTETIPAGTGGGTTPEVPELTELAAPTNLNWHRFYNNREAYDNTYVTINGMLSWQVPDANKDKTFDMHVKVYKEGETEETFYGIWGYEPSRKQTYWTDWDFMLQDFESGKYKFTVQFVSEDQTVGSSGIAGSAYWDYVKPTTSMAAPTNLRWTDTEDGMTANWDAVENSGGYVIDTYYSPDNANATSAEDLELVLGFVYYEPIDGEHTSFVPWEEKVQDNGYYYFTVRTVSPNISENKHSVDSALSPAYAKGVGTGGTTPEVPESDVPAVANAYFSNGELRVKYSFNEKTEEAFENAKYLKAEIWDGENWVTIMDNMGIRTDGGEGNFYVTYNSIDYSVPAGHYTKLRFTTVAKYGHTDAVSAFDFDLTINRATDETKPAKITNIVYDETEEIYNVTLTGLAGSPDGIIMFNEEEDLRSCQVAYFHEDAFNGDESADAVITADPSYVRNLTEESKYIVFTVAQDVQTTDEEFDFDFDFDKTKASVTVTDVSGWKPCYEKCEHQWNEGEVTTPATCGADGVKTFTCTLCEATKTEVIPATGEHNYVGEVTTQPTCCEEGVKTFTCTLGCGATKTESVPATNNHTWSTVYSKNDQLHWFKCTNPECEAKDEISEHSSDNKICNVDSVCECGYVVKKAGQHSYEEQWQMNADGHWKNCTVEGCTGKISEAHTPVVDEAVPPTETTEGKTEGSHCEICGYTIKAQTNIPALTAQDVYWLPGGPVTITYGEFKYVNNTAYNDSNDENEDDVFTYSSSDESVATVDANGKATIVGAGECEIIATAAAVPGKYIETSASYKFIVKKALLTIKANDKDIVYGAAPANNGWTATGYKYNDTADVVKGTAAYTYNYEQFGNAGTYEIGVSGLTADNYEITFETGALKVNKASAYTITLGNLEQLDKEVTAVTTAIAPQDTTAVIKVEYYINNEWVETLPTEAGEYPVHASLVSSDNIAIDGAYTEETLIVNRSIVVGDTNIEVNVDGEKAEIVITDDELKEIIEKTEGEVTVKLGGVENVTELEIPGAFVDAVSKSEKTDGMVINTDNSSISMSEAVVDTVAENVKSGEDTIAVKLEAIEKNKLNDKQQAALDAITQDAVIVEVSLVITHADGGETVLHQLGGNVEVTVPYAGPVAEGKYIVVSYVSDDGNVSYVRATYNAETKQVTFKTNHFSNYAIFESGNPSVVVNEGTGNGIYEAGATVTIKADEKSGYTFAGWQVNAGAVTLADASKAETTFVMPSENVEITATYRQNTPSGGGGGFAPSKPVAPEYVNPFTDVKEGDYFFDAVKWAVENDVTTGTTETTFSPDMICTRAQAVTFLYRAAGSPVVKGKEMPFADVADDAYFYNAVLWAMENGITKGVSETEFAPDMICTREQIVTFLYRTAISMGKDVSVGEETNILSYDDAFDIGEWAIPAVQWAVGDGVMTGTSESTLAPQMECTRAQIVTFLFRAFEE